MSIQDKLKDIKDQKRYSSPAKRTMEHLKPILSKSSELSKRWVWELLQNASDLGDEIKTEFEITDYHLIFRHNGKPFSLDEAFNLIMPDSSKDDESLHKKDNKKPLIGQFGTGFISTHILSRTVQVNGIVEDSEENDFFSFSFKLDRSERKNKDFLIEEIKNSEKQYSESLQKLSRYEPSEFDTEFVYDITNTYASLSSSQIIEDGINTLEELLPFVFAFRPQIKAVKIKDYRNGNHSMKTFKRNFLESETQGIEFVQTTCELNNETINTDTIATIKEGKTLIAVKGKHISEHRFALQDFPEYSPVLYCAFPMIGAIGFNFPVVIHSEYFVPNRERDGIEISEHDKENRESLLEAKEAFSRLIDVVEEKCWEQSQYLFNLSTVKFSNDEIHKWYFREIYTPIKKKLRSSNIVKISDGTNEEFSSFEQIYIPYIDKRKSDKYENLTVLYQLSNELFPDELPIQTDYKSWYDIVDFEIFEDEKLDIDKLLDKISDDCNNISDFEQKYKKNNVETISYLKQLINYVTINEKENLLNDYKIIPNQVGDLCFQKKLKLDFVSHKGLIDGYGEKLKVIGCNLVDENCKEFLLHKDFEDIPHLIDSDEKYDLSELAKNIDEKLRNFDGSFNNERFLLVLKDLFNWHTNCGISNDTLGKLFPYFSLNKSQLYLNTKSPDELEYAFDIEISGKSKLLARIARSNLSDDELDIIAKNPDLVSSFINWLNHKQENNPDEELGNIGEEFLHYQLCQIFGENRVLWEDKSEYDFRILEKDLSTSKYFIDAKTTSRGIANSDNVPFYMRIAQWNFLEREQAFDKYLIARIYKNGSGFNVKYVKINLIEMK